MNNFRERVTNDEFLKLLPHLNLEQSFLTQVFVDKRGWINLLDANLQTLELKCGVCRKQIGFEKIKNHLIDKEHLMSVRSNAKQFYHPFYTYRKGDVKLARGEYGSQEMLEKVLLEIDMQKESYRNECILAKEFVEIAERISREADMIVKVCLPFTDIPKVLFCVVSGEWQPILKYKNLRRKSHFHCNICSVNCTGIDSLNSHLNGFNHRLIQLEVLALRYEENSKINKNCCIYFGNSFQISVKEKSKRQMGNDFNSPLDKLSNVIIKKIKALDEHVPKVYNLDHSCEKTTYEKDGKIEYNEYLGHLGVEYVLKIIKSDNDRNPHFECGLCEVVGDTNKMQRHLLYYEHKKKYLDFHYSDTIKNYENLIGHMSFVDFRDVMSQIVDKLAIEIEKRHSRSLPYTVLFNDYKARRPDLIAEAYGLLHASQYRGQSFSDVFSKDDISNLKKSISQQAVTKANKSIDYVLFTIAPKTKIYLNQLSHDPVVRFREYKAKMNKSHQSQQETQINNQPKRDDLRNERLHKRVHEERTRSRSPLFKSSRSPTRRSRCDVQSTNTFLNQNIWDIYRREIAIAANEIEIAYENYRKNPESHPLYEEEWNNFWQHRKKQLEREGFNHRTYNYQPEWIHYFKQRIEALFGEALHRSQINIRHRLDIPLNAEEDCQRGNEESSKKFCADRRSDQKYPRERSFEDIDVFKRQTRRSSNELKGNVPENKRIFPEEMHLERNKEESNLVVTRINDNHSNVVHVLRLIIALEDHLGSLGGKIMDLLSYALQLEKNFAGKNFDFESQILTVGNCQLLETTMEKLKGILFAGLLDEKNISGFNRVIQHTGNLLKYAEKMGWRQVSCEPEKKSFPDGNSNRMIQNSNSNINVIQHRGGSGGENQISKALSDTLMDFMKKPQMDQQQIGISKKQQLAALKKIPDCPSPPNIKESTNVSANFFAGFKGHQQSNSSGLASFNTKLSFYQQNETPNLQSSQSEFGQQHRNANIGRISSYNNSFRNNNETRTNINNRSNNGPVFGSGMNYNSASSTSQFGKSQFIPNKGQNNPMFQGGGAGGNRNQN